MKRVAVYAGTRNIYQNMVVAAKSLLWHTRMDRVIFLIEDDTFPEPLPGVIETLNVSGQKFFPPDGPNYQSRWTYMTLMRLALPELLPEEKRALWLDVDTIVTEDIGALFETDLGGCCVGAVREPEWSRPGRVYYNAGVLLMDLDALRGDLCERLIQRINSVPMDFKDQDAINDVCKGRIIDLPAIWNASEWTAKPLESKITHFAADREYTRQPLFKAYERKEWRDCHADEN